MKNLIPLMALLVVGGSFVAAPAAMAGGKCAEGDACCKDGAKKGAKKAKTETKAKGDAETKPADAK